MPNDLTLSRRLITLWRCGHPHKLIAQHLGKPLEWVVRRCDFLELLKLNGRI